VRLQRDPRPLIAEKDASLGFAHVSCVESIEVWDGASGYFDRSGCAVPWITPH